MRGCLVFLSFMLASLNAWAVNGNPCADFSDKINVAYASGSTAGTSYGQIIAGVAGQRITICSLYVEGVSGSSTPTFSLVQGSGTTCNTNESQVLFPVSTVSTNFYAFPEPIAATNLGNNLCYLDGGTSPIQDWWISYIQI